MSFPLLTTTHFGNCDDQSAIRRAVPLFVAKRLGVMICVGAAALAFFGLRPSLAQESGITDQQLVFFESKVRPLLAEHCWSCHGKDEQKGDLRLDSLTAIHAGGESGSALDADDRAASLLLEAVRYESYEMPPSGKLSGDKIAILERWVEMGAPWPGQTVDRQSMPSKSPAGNKISDEDRKWWAFQPLVQPTVPDITAIQAGDGPLSTLAATSLWKDNPVDAFILDSMSSQSLYPAPPADRVSIVRRLYFDLIGLPPTPEQVEDFVNDDSSGAYERLVDQLLDNPQFGQRWARHWLDLVRYADSDGYRIDHYRPQAWRYRDYVIRAFNDDKPYDRFVQEQLAGDEMFPGDSDALIATGFLRHWIYEYNNRDALGQWRTIIEDVTDTTGDVFLGMGMQCAKCHDHKFDPILQRDYYRLQAFFQPLMPLDAAVPSPGERDQYEAELATWEAETKDIRDQIYEIESKYHAAATKAAVEKFPLETQEFYNKPIDQQTPYERQISYLVQRQVDFEFDRLDGKIKGDDKEAVLALRRELAKFDANKPKPLPVALTVRDVGPEAPQTMIPKRSKEPVAPGFLTLLDDSDAEIQPIPDAPTTGRRTALARWLTQPDHPLTSRVIANRLWQYHFGRGLASNSSDFGKLGGQPTHPELLDFLANYLVENDWSLKSLHRLIVTSAAYRQSTSHPQFSSLTVIDPSNRYYWRADTRRLDAEQIRDSVLAVSGKLVPMAGGEGVMGDSPRRTIFTRSMRNSRDPFLDVFDLPDFFTSESSRNTTTTPVQSLMLLNSPQLLRYAEALANRVMDGNQDPVQAVEKLWRLAFGRSPEPSEKEGALAFLESQFQVISQVSPDTKAHEFVIGKMAYRDGASISVSPDSDQPRLAVANRQELELDDFTIETFIQPRSIYDTGSVRTAVSKWNGKSGSPGWGLGITGKGSRRKPQTLVIQLWGKKLDGSFGEAALFSDHHVEMNKPYFVSAVVTMAKPANGDHPAEPGSVNFFLKDLSNDDEPLLSVSVPHAIVGGLSNNQPLVIGGRGDKTSVFDGLVDSVRISSGALDQAGLLFTGESVADSTVGYWRFESDPGVRRDSSPNGLDLIDSSAIATASDPIAGAMIDLCHAVLNSNEFLYSP